MDMCTRWWLRHCLKCQARKTPRLTVRWPIISMPLPEGLGVAISVDYFGPVPVTPRGNTYILMNLLVNKYIPLCGCPPPYSRTTACNSPPRGDVRLLPPENVARTSARAQTCVRGPRELSACHGVRSTKNDPLAEEKQIPKGQKNTFVHSARFPLEMCVNVKSRG